MEPTISPDGQVAGVMVGASSTSSPTATSRRARSSRRRRGDGPPPPPVVPELLGDDWAHGVEPAIDIALLGRYYERIADHAVSIARRVVFLVTGETIPMLDA